SACCAEYSQAQQVVDLRTGILNKEVTSTVPTRDIKKQQDGYLVTYTFDKAFIQSDKLFAGTKFWKIDGFGINQTPGEPSTLMRNDMFAVPFGYTAKVEVVDSTYSDFCYELTPARQHLVDSSNEIYTKQNVLAIKPYDGFKPSTIVSQSGLQTYRGHNLCQISLSPIQYNYNAKKVRAYTSITFKVTFIPEKTISTNNRNVPKYISCEDNFLKNNVIGEDFEDTNVTRTENTAQADVRDYLIISTNQYAEAAYRLAEWKRLLGFKVYVELREQWSSTNVDFLASEAYYGLPALYYVLIIGDHNDVPAQQSSLLNSHVTDFYYGCADNDYIPEMYCGRLSVSTPEEAMTVVEKIINYEKTPPTNSSFYNNGLNCAYFQDYDNFDTYADRRFAQTSEDVRSYVMTQGKSVQRVYSTLANVTPLYWNDGPWSNGESIPNELKKPGFAWDGNAADITNAINNGVFYVLHRDHGEVGYWGDPRYTQQNISTLSNGNLLPVVFSMNCLTGKFDSYCFCESFLRKPNGGCVGIYGATQVSYTGDNDALTTGMFDAIWPDPGLSITMPWYDINNYSITPTPTYTLGQILGQGMVRLAETIGSITDTYTIYAKEIFHCFGDPSMMIYTQAPTPFSNVSIVRGSGSVSVNLGANETARITAYNPISGDVKSYIGNSVSITTPNPNETIVCVSAHNRIPFIQNPDTLY
ncbi:MAG: hypothetical protein K5874_05960, partial [Bacteroidaceae bacterium]|nr:hypothetical protein [Bacteroidaceae bacterium]